MPIIAGRDGFIVARLLAPDGVTVKQEVIIGDNTNTQSYLDSEGAVREVTFTVEPGDIIVISPRIQIPEGTLPPSIYSKDYTDQGIVVVANNLSPYNDPNFYNTTYTRFASLPIPGQSYKVYKSVEGDTQPSRADIYDKPILGIIDIPTV